MPVTATRAAPKEQSANRAWLRALECTAKIDDTPERIFPLVIEELGARFGDAPALISPGETFSHAALAVQANRYARWAMAEGVGKGDVVALLMPNRADYLAIWLGITRVGGVVALINTNLIGAALDHCLTVAAPKHIIVDERLAPAMNAAVTPARIWRHRQEFSDIIAHYSGGPLTTGETREVTLSDPALLIYTSGTTGLPKAAFVSHHRVMMWTHWFAGLMDAGPDDRLYNCLPMYHSVGGVVASCAVLLAGGAVILREKFSARAFWDDIEASGATIFQYIGELCRYLLKSDAQPRRHGLRLICGNGLSADVWTGFQERFRIPQILEFYAATEGNFSLYNAEGQPGAIGRIPGFLKHRFGVALIARGPDGRSPGAGRTASAAGWKPAKRARPSARLRTARRVSRAIATRRPPPKKSSAMSLPPGDAWVRTGDLMRQDAQGFFYFVDRLGDTFRWKGENVATTEIAAVLAAYPGIIAANVYGVVIPGADGRAGMAALETGADFDSLGGLKAHLKGAPAGLCPARFSSGWCHHWQ